MLVGRGSERAQIDALLESARAGSSGALVLRGEPGIGKTALLEYAVEQAEDFQVLRATGIEAESDLPFSALQELLRPVVDRIDALPEPQAVGLKTALALAPPLPIDRLTVSVATLTLLSDASEDRSLLCVVDDAQWIDPASSEVMVFASRRLRAERAVFLFAVREGEKRAAFEPSGLAELHLGPLHADAAEMLLEQGNSRLSRQVASRVLELSAGNPLALIELPHALTDGQRTGAETIEEPIAMGRRLEEAFLRRVHSLPAETQAALVVAAANETDDLHTISSATKAMGMPIQALDAAERARLVIRRDGSFAFVHPLVRSAIYSSADPIERRRAHGVIAAVLEERRDMRYAWHLAAAATGVDEEVASALERAAEAAGRRGGAAAESVAYERAARFSEDPGARARRLRAAAAVAARGGGMARVENLCREALALAPDAGLVGDIYKVLVQTLLWGGQLEAAHRVMMTTSYELEADAPVDAAHMRARATTPLTHMLRGEEAAAVARSALELMRRSGGEDARVVTMLAHVLARLGKYTEAQPLAESGLAAYERSRAPDLRWNLSDLLLLLGQHERAEELWAPVASEARALAAASQLAIDLEHAACLDESRGRLYLAYTAALESVQLAEELEDEPLQRAYSMTRLAAVTAQLGRDRETREVAPRAVEYARRCASRFLEARTRAAVGMLELSLGHPAAALAELEPVRQMVRGAGFRNPAFVQFSPELVEAYTQTGNVGAARGELEELERDAAEATTPWAAAVAARCRGLLAPDDAFENEFERALQLHGSSPRVLERARTQLLYGERLRRVGRRVRARAELRAALETFDSSGATVWASRARDELRATGEQIQSDEARREDLTPQELQVALVVSRGATNKEAANQLFLSPKTIEFHLRNAYRKLGVRSRTELANALLLPLT